MREYTWCICIVDAKQFYETYPRPTLGTLPAVVLEIFLDILISFDIPNLWPLDGDAALCQMLCSRS